MIKLLVMMTLAAFIFAANGEYIDRFLGQIGMGAITDSNQRYLQNSFDRAASGFLVLSGIKSGLAIIEGSHVGVGFSLEVGDIVQSVYDYVDIAWKTVLAGGTILLLTRLTLDAAATIDHFFLSLLFFLFFIHRIAKWYLPHAVTISRFLRDAAMFFTVISLSLYFVLPLSIKGASLLSQKISQPLIQEAQTNFEGIQDEFSSSVISQRLFPDRDPGKNNWYAKLNLSEDYEAFKNRLASLQDYFAERTRWFSVWTIKLIAGYLFDCIVFPLTFLIILFVFTKGMANYFFTISRSSSIKKDMESILVKYYGKVSEPSGMIKKSSDI